ncbi:YdcF family protein [Mesorhizobium sp. WSM4307]|uniref:YdcF family protein n=1 Tax=unclassified Mesorhizobium TaxID=325217 RepID=UPI000BB0B078|nr:MULTISPECIES: YdcF family protein [unclassified Mesorhizobium]PBB22738.1 hypothetical protein CK232_31855 [Mesorhizobium sp. WSM4304]PBB71230.1 hypothetical protein CK227_32915 [Mesorhizobium sp. WSM4308]TRC73049.1 YdcF family protein [Mesorhizobium sp. WSM4315]TRC83336.1 YdcF family protein [Mesorhizobium sp. WSM4307]
MVSATALELAKVLWEYNYCSNPPQDADVLIVMGTNDLSVPRYAAEIAIRHAYRWIVVSGGVRHSVALHGESFGGTEADVFARIMSERGTHSTRIMLENAAKNTGANILESKLLLEQNNAAVRTGQLVHTPTMQRRACDGSEAMAIGFMEHQLQPNDLRGLHEKPQS